MLERFRKFDLIKNYVAEKQEEISSDNKEHTLNPEQLINGRRQTNIGVFVIICHQTNKIISTEGTIQSY